MKGFEAYVSGVGETVRESKQEDLEIYKKEKTYENGDNVSGDKVISDKFELSTEKQRIAKCDLNLQIKQMVQKI